MGDASVGKVGDVVVVARRRDRHTTLYCQKDVTRGIRRHWRDRERKERTYVEVTDLKYSWQLEQIPNEISLAL
jgi:hypothetical protein